MPFGIGPGEIILILVIALIVVGPGKLPDVGAALGKSIREFRKAATDVNESVNLEAAPAPTAPTAPTTQVAPTAQAPAPVAAPAAQAPVAPPPPPVAPPIPPVVPAVALTAAALEVPADVAQPDADAASGWPAEVAPVDEQQPTASS